MKLILHIMQEHVYPMIRDGGSKRGNVTPQWVFQNYKIHGLSLGLMGGGPNLSTLVNRAVPFK